MTAPSPPIDIGTPKRFSSTSPPQNQASNLTTALQKAQNNPATKPVDAPSKAIIQDARPSSGRKDSTGALLGSSHSDARPMAIAGSGPRKDSGPGSYMGGMSWGGISMGSFLQDDIMMTGTSPFDTQSPSFHSSSYLPKMEATFWNNLKCCDSTFNDLHELLAHFEDVHSQAPSTFPYRMSVGSSGLPRRKSSTRPFMGNGLAQAGTPSNQVRGFQPPSSSDGKPNGSSSLRPTMPGQNGFQKPLSSNGTQDMDPIGQMDMDDDMAPPLDGTVPNYIAPTQTFSQNTTPRLATATPNLVTNLNPDLSFSDPSTPIAGTQQQQQLQQLQQQLQQQQQQQQRRFVGQNNPMVSSVNTPTLSAPQTTQGSPENGVQSPAMANGAFLAGNLQFDPQMLENLNAGFGNLDFGANNSMADYCIDEPAKALYSDNGAINSARFPQFNFENNGKATDDVSQNLAARRLAAGLAANGAVLPNDEDRPFKCPVIGCEKAYKNANGLRYHEKHGHATQQLKENPDGTMSIVDPATSMPYPGTVGMEKEKPYRCEVCGKRYKNLNGLKYHRNHSPPCNPDFDINGFAAAGGGLQDSATATGEPVF